MPEDHAKALIDILQHDGRYSLVGLIDTSSELHGSSSSLQGVAVFGGDDRLQGLRREGVSHFFVGVGGAADNTPRKRLFELGLRQGMELVDVVHRQAVVSIHARLGKGIAIMSGAVVEHDCVIGDHVHLAHGRAWPVVSW